jgi:hypothetical protein
MASANGREAFGLPNCASRDPKRNSAYPSPAGPRLLRSTTVNDLHVLRIEQFSDCAHKTIQLDSVIGLSSSWHVLNGLPDNKPP